MSGLHLRICAAGKPPAVRVESRLKEGGAEQAQQARGGRADARGGRQQGCGQGGVGGVVQVVVQQMGDVLLPALQRLVRRVQRVQLPSIV